MRRSWPEDRRRSNTCCLWPVYRKRFEWLAHSSISTISCPLCNRCFFARFPLESKIMSSGRLPTSGAFNNSNVFFFPLAVVYVNVVSSTRTLVAPSRYPSELPIRSHPRWMLSCSDGRQLSNADPGLLDSLVSQLVEILIPHLKSFFRVHLCILARIQVDVCVSTPGYGRQNFLKSDFLAVKAMAHCKYIEIIGPH